MSVSQLTRSVRRVALLAVAVWIFLLLYLSRSLFLLSSKDSKPNVNDALLEQYGRAVEDLNVLRKQNAELKELLKEKTAKLSLSQNRTSLPPLSQSSKSDCSQALFSDKHEIARRSLDNSLRELYFYLNDQLGRSNVSFASHALNQFYFVLGQSAAFSDIDGADEWRNGNLLNISAEILARIHALQNPDDCSAAKKLVCNLNKGCGFGCQLHHVTYCFIVAYGTNRTLLLLRDGHTWNYSPNGWASAFLPVSKCSYDIITKDGDQVVEWPGLQQSASEKVISMPIVDGLRNRPNFLPLAFPEQYADALIKFHANPSVFFISQFMRYLMRPSDNMRQRVEEAAAKVPFNEGPIVGLQIRRTDKVGTEAAFHSLGEYMKWAEVWFKVQEYRLGKKLKRKIFIATDDPGVFREARKSYLDYEVFGDSSVAESAQLGSRYTENSLTGVIIDIELLARCSYLVCTFSSQVCRIGYELMQVRIGDAGENFHSLDDLYYYGGQQAHEQVAIGSYKAETGEEIDLEKGDVIGVAGNHWNGFSKGTNRRTGKNGLYPSYLAREKWIAVPFP